MKINMQADLYAGALFITQATQIEGDSAIYVAILILLAIACVFTVAGGLSAVIYTDTVQARDMDKTCTSIASKSCYKLCNCCRQ